jgi:hypothetical protein
MVKKFVCFWLRLFQCNRNNKNHYLGLLVILLMVSYTTPVRAADSSNLESNPQKQTPIQQLDFSISFESNRTLGDKETVREVYKLLFDDHYKLQEGVSFNTTTGQINAIFIDLGYQKINNSNYGLNLKFLGNQYGEYSKAANSIIPYVSWDNSDYFIDMGLNYRFLNSNEAQLWNIFYYNTPIYEIIPFYRLGFRFISQDKRFTTVLEANNCDEMYAGNLGAYGFFLHNKFTLNRKIAFFGNLGFRQSGSIALAATFYSATLLCGVEEHF